MSREELREKLRGQVPALIRMTETDGFKLFMEWVALQADHFGETVKRADNEDAWRVARAEYTSYKNMLSMPQILLEEIRAIDSDSQPTEVQ